MCNELDKPLAMPIKRAWRLEKLSVKSQHTKVTVAFKKGERKEPNSHKSVSLPWPN